MLISLIIPIYNEESLIETLFERVINALSSITQDFEIICVDDGSQDHSLQKLKGCHERDKRFKIIALSRNFGHQPAYTAGLAYAKGDIIVMMDGDLQDPPELIPEMVKTYQSGQFDIVHCKRKSREDTALRKILFRCFHFAFKKLSNLEEIQNAGNFSLLNRKALEALLSFKEKNRYLPGLRFFIGFRQGVIEYERNVRHSGEAKMSFMKLVKLGMDAIFSFSELPIRLCLITGLTGMLICFFAFVYVMFGKLTGIAPFGWSSTTLSIFFMGFIQLIFLGIMGEYLFRTFNESRNRPLYFIQEIIE